MSKNSLPSGVLTATVTPFLSDRSPNHQLLFEHCSDLLRRGSKGIALLGTTGEANSISNKYRKEILEELVGRGFEKHLLVVGTSTCSIDDTIELTQHCVDLGVNNILLMPPWYYRGVSEDGLFNYFSTLINEISSDALRIYIYHFPRMSGIDLPIHFIQRLINTYGEVIAGMKDSSGDITHMISMIQAFPQLDIFAGTEKLLVPVLEAGGVGCISATTNYGIDVAARVYDSWCAGQVDHNMEKTMVANRTAFEGNNFASAIKSVLGINEPGFLKVLEPLTNLPEAERDTLLNELQNQEQ